MTAPSPRVVARRCCTAAPIARVHLSHGCQAWDDRDQDLCPQHLRSVEPVGDMRIVAEYDPGAVAWVFGR